MTLIIGFKCKEGIALVSDTKITDLETGEVLYESKILSPLENTAFIVGAAGYTNLFSEFTRKISKTVSKRIAQIRIQNIQELMKTGLSREKALKYIHEKELCTTTNLRHVQDIENNQCQSTELEEYEIELPHVYSEEELIDDCKSLVKKVNSQSATVTEPLELLIGVKPSDKVLHVHHIDPEGFEQEINDYFAIGTGHPFVKMFFSHFYDYNKGLNELITQCFRAILYTTIVAKESSVGYSQDFPPEAVIILNDGKYGKITFENEWEIITELEKEMEGFVHLVKQENQSMLQSTMDSPVIL